MITDMAKVAAECFNHPRRRSVWFEELNKYLCPDSDEGRKALEAGIVTPGSTDSVRPSLNPQFKLVFLAAASGTLLALALCVTLTLLAGKTPPPLLERVVMGVFDLAKVGFGAIVGLLGAQTMQGTAETTRRQRKRLAHTDGDQTYGCVSRFVQGSAALQSAPDERRWQPERRSQGGRGAAVSLC